MSRRIVNFIVLIFFIFTIQSSYAAPPSRQSLEALLETSGLNASLEVLEQTLVTNAVAQASSSKPQSETAGRLIEILLAENLKETFRYALLLDEVTYILKKKVSEEDVQVMLDWYRSDLGQRIKKAEDAANSPEGMTAIQREMNSLLKQQDLTAMAAEVDEAIGLSNAMVDLQINIQKALVLAGLAIVAPGEDLSKIEHANWAAIETSDRAALRQPIEQQFQATFAYTMKGFSKQERDLYREVMLKTSTIKVVDAVMTGISKAVEIGAHNFMTELAKDLKEPSPELERLLKEYSASTTETETRSDSNSDW
jgi:hypothetical protein